MVLPVVVIDPMLLLEIATVPPLLEPIPKLRFACPVSLVLRVTLPILVLLPIVLPAVVPTFTLPPFT